MAKASRYEATTPKLNESAISSKFSQTAVGDANVTTNTQGFGQAYLKLLAGSVRASIVLKQDAKVQRAYTQAQINDLSDKVVEVANKQSDFVSFTENQDKFMRQFKETLNTFENRLTSLKFDEAGFNERCVKVFTLFD